MALLTETGGGCFFIMEDLMESSLGLGVFIFGNLSIVILFIRSMISINQNLKSRLSRMKEIKLF
jgi:hypothetical protein